MEKETSFGTHYVRKSKQEFGNDFSRVREKSSGFTGTSPEEEWFTLWDLSSVRTRRSGRKANKKLDNIYF